MAKKNKIFLRLEEIQLYQNCLQVQADAILS